MGVVVIAMLVGVFGKVEAIEAMSVLRAGMGSCGETGPGIRNGKIKKTITFISPCAMEAPSIDPLRFTMAPKNKPTINTSIESSAD